MRCARLAFMIFMLRRDLRRPALLPSAVSQQVPPDCSAQLPSAWRQRPTAALILPFPPVYAQSSGSLWHGPSWLMLRRECKGLQRPARPLCPRSWHFKASRPPSRPSPCPTRRSPAPLRWTSSSGCPLDFRLALFGGFGRVWGMLTWQRLSSQLVTCTMFSPTSVRWDVSAQLAGAKLC